MRKTIAHLSGTDRSWYYQSFHRSAGTLREGSEADSHEIDWVSSKRSRSNTELTAEMQCVGTFKEFYDLLTETHKRHKKKPSELEKELRKVIKRGKEMLQELQDRFV